MWTQEAFNIGSNESFDYASKVTIFSFDYASKRTNLVQITISSQTLRCAFRYATTGPQNKLWSFDIYKCEFDFCWFLMKNMDFKWRIGVFFYKFQKADNGLVFWKDTFHFLVTKESDILVKLSFDEKRVMGEGTFGAICFFWF